MPVCKSCGQPIEWLKLKSGSSHPINPDPVMIETSGQPIQGYKSHFATCPNADQHRQSRNPNPPNQTQNQDQYKQPQPQFQKDDDLPF